VIPVERDACFGIYLPTSAPTKAIHNGDPSESGFHKVGNKARYAKINASSRALCMSRYVKRRRRPSLTAQCDLLRPGSESTNNFNVDPRFAEPFLENVDRAICEPV